MRFYYIALAKSDGSWEFLEKFEATNDDKANEYAAKNYDGQEWYVLDSRRENIN